MARSTVRAENRYPVLSRRSFLAGALACGAVSVLAGCTRADAGDGSAQGSGALLIGSDDADGFEADLAISIDEAASIEPFDATDTASFQAVSLLFDPLTRYDFESGELTGLAAESWDVSDDAMTFTFHLVEGATFHDGEEVTSFSFKRAWERMVNPASTASEVLGISGASYHLALVEGYEELAEGGSAGLAGISCPDDVTLVVALSAPYADFPYVVAHPALSPVPIAAQSDPAGFFAAPVGNGPFMVAEGTSWGPGESLDLVRYDGYHGEAATIERVRLEAAGDSEAAYASFVSGDLDVISVPIGEYAGLKKDLGLSEDGRTMGGDERVAVGTEPAVSYLACNVGVSPLDNLDVRRGLSLAIDRESICEDVYQDTRVPADGIVPSPVRGYSEGSWEFAAYDADLAAAYLDKAYPADEEGARSLQLTLTYNEDGGHEELVAAIVDDLDRVGVAVEEEPVPWDELVERFASGEFELGLTGWTADYPIQDNVLYPLFHSDNIGGSNRSGFSDEEVDAAIDEARTMVDDDERVSALVDVDAMVGESVPVIPLMYDAHVMACSDRVESLYCDPMGCVDAAIVVLAE